MNQNLTDLRPIFQWLAMSCYSTIVWLWALWDSNHCLLTYFDLYSWPTANRNLPDVPHKLCFLSVSFTYTATLVWFMSLGFHLAQAMELTFAKPFISLLWPQGVPTQRTQGRVARRHAWNFLLATKGTKCLLFLNSPFKSRPHCKIVSMEITFFKVCQPMAEFGIRSSSLIVDGTHYSKSISIVMRKSER